MDAVSSDHVLPKRLGQYLRSPTVQGISERPPLHIYLMGRAQVRMFPHLMPANTSYIAGHPLLLHAVLEGSSRKARGAGEPGSRGVHGRRMASLSTSTLATLLLVCGVHPASLFQCTLDALHNARYPWLVLTAGLHSPGHSILRQGIGWMAWGVSPVAKAGEKPKGSVPPCTYIWETSLDQASNGASAAGLAYLHTP